jgi:hypothetical protein
VSYQGGQYRYLKLSVKNNDNQPLQLKDLQVYGYITKILFPLEKSRSYHLYYGNPNAKTPVYDIGEFSAYINEPGLAVLGLGNQTNNPEFNSRTQRPWTEDNRWLLTTVLLAVVAILAFWVVKMIKNMSQEL